MPSENSLEFGLSGGFVLCYIFSVMGLVLEYVLDL